MLKCLEKDRTRRYATANGLAMDIEHYLHEEAVLARPPSQLYRLQKLVRRNRMVFLFGAAAAAALLLGTIISTMMFVKEREARSSEARLRREAELREQASHVASLVTQGRFDEADKLVAGLPLDKPSVEVSAELRALGDWHAANGRWPEAAARFESVVEGEPTRCSGPGFRGSIETGGGLPQVGKPAGLRAIPPDRSGQARPDQHRLRIPDLQSRPAAATRSEHAAVVSFSGRKLVEKRFPNDERDAPKPASCGAMVGGAGSAGVSAGAFFQSPVLVLSLRGLPVDNANAAAAATFP